jgi:acyl-CoA reductase-like NAD-dependent aldehyde dehydrogenase
VVRREPYGVAALITPFNAPFFLACMKLAPALAAGCPVVLKPSPLPPLCAFAVAEIAAEAELPPGVLNVVTGSAESGELLTTDPRVDLVSFTGSDTVGRQIMAQAAPTLKKLVLALGGKSANIVCDDAEAVQLANDSDYGLAGGVWSASPTRAYGIAERIRAGTIVVNGGAPGTSPHSPFGGYKQSGLGREWGRYGLEEYLETKSVVWPVARG